LRITAFNLRPSPELPSSRQWSSIAGEAAKPAFLLVDKFPQSLTLAKKCTPK